MPRKLLLSILGLAVTCTVCCGQTRPPDEKSLWLLWKRHLDNPDNHTEIAALCEESGKKTPHDPFIAVSQGIAAWHLLKAGKIDSATKTLEHMLSKRPNLPATAGVKAGHLHNAGSRMARAWLTRIDREKVKLALRKLYIKEIQYPKSLDTVKSLPKEHWPSLTDRWGKPWLYRLVGFKRLRGFYGQKYELKSTMLGRNSDLSKSLEIPYAGRIDLKPVKLIFSAYGKETVRFVTQSSRSEDTVTSSTGKKEKSVILSVGAKSGGIFFVYMGKNILILSDGDYWKIMPKPR